MSEEECPTLKWGDIIRIHGVNLTKKNQVKGLIISKGFTDSNIYYQKYQDFSDVNFYRQSLFQILPPTNFDMHDQLQDQSIPAQQKQSIRTRAVAQIIGLYNNFKTKAGKQVTYGKSVIFKHVQSQSYLRGILKAADTGQGAFKVQVCSSLSSDVIFKLTSHRSYQRDEDKIYYDDPLQIYHPRADCFTNFVENDEPIYIDSYLKKTQLEEGHEFKQFVQKRPFIKKPIHFRVPVINQNKSKCLWKFIQHCSYDDYNDKKTIKSHDIVYFQHTKKKGLVSSTLAQPINYYLKQASNNTLSYDCFWQLIPKQIKQTEAEDWSCFKARSIITGKQLTFKNTVVQIKPDNQNGSKVFQNQGRVSLQILDNQKIQKLQRGHQMEAVQHRQKIVQYYQSKVSKIDFVGVNKMTQDILQIYKVNQQTVMDVQYAISSLQPLVKLVQILTQSFSTQNDIDFQYPKVFPQLNQDFLINIIAILKQLTGKIYNTDFQNIFASGNLPNQNFQKILVETGITEILIQILNLLYKSIKFIIKHQNQPSDDRAIRYRISQIFQFTYKLLQKIAVGFQENRIYISRWVDIFLEHSNNINCSYIQETLVGILQNNPVSIQATINEKKIVNLIDSFFAQAKKQTSYLTTKYLRLFSTFIKCENRILKQNQNIILNSFFKNTDNEYSFRFKIEMKPQYEPVEVKGVFEKALGKQVYISFGKQQFTTIPKFYRDWKSKWDYFMFFVNLLADISMDRNKQSIRDVGILLSLQSIVIILFDPDIRKLNKQITEDLLKQSQGGKGQSQAISNVHQPFLRVAHYVYINNESFSPIKRIKKISQWYQEKKIRQEYDNYGQKQIIVIPEDINVSKRQFNGQKQEQQRSYLHSILTYVKQFLKHCDQNTINLAILLTILNLIKQTIVLGLWNSIDHFRQMIPLIIMRIARIQKNNLFYADEETKGKKTSQQIVKLNKSLLLLNRPEIQMNINCKILATQIIRLMNQLQIDIRLRYMMKFFKGLYETTINFNQYDKVQKQQFHHQAQEADKQRSQQAKKVFYQKDGSELLGDIKKVSQDQQIILKQNIWFNKLKKMTPFTYLSENKNTQFDRYLFQGVPQQNSNAQFFEVQFKNICLSLFQLSSFQNYKILNSSLEMIRSMFEQRKELLDYFKAILICGKGNLNEVYLTLKFMRQKFDMLNNFNIKSYQGNFDSKNFPFAFWKPYDSTQKKKQQRSGIIQDLFFLTRTLKQNMNLKNIQSLMHVDLQVFDLNIVYKYMDQKQKNNQLFQAVNLAQGIYVPLVYYLRIMKDVEVLPQIHRHLICSIFQYLTLLCFNFLQAKQILMQYIQDIVPFLDKKVGAAPFICQLCKNNKILISNEDIVATIIQYSLQSCMNLDKSQGTEVFLLQRDPQELINTDYQKSLIFHSLRGLLIFNQKGFHRNQQILMNRLQDSKFKKLIYKNKFQFHQRINNFNLTPEESYVANCFQLFSLLVQQKNLVNIGKLQNIHPYTYCLQCLKSTNRWQIRRSLRAYINRLYYVNKEKDLFLFQQFIRKQFDIINTQLSDLVQLHRYKMISDELTMKNGIRFLYAESQILIVMIQIFISIHEMFLKPQFIKALKKQLIKEEKYNDTNRILHQKIIRLFKYVGCLNKLYPHTKTIGPFIKQIKRLLTLIVQKMQQKYLAKKSEPDGQLGEKPELEDEIGKQVEKKSYVYDHSKSFFRNLSIMIRDIKAKKRLLDLKNQYQRRKKQGYCNYVQTIFSVPNQKLKPLHQKKQKKAPAHQNPHLQTTTSKVFKVLAKPELNQNQQNMKLNQRLITVKQLLQNKPIFDKFKQNQFYKLVSIFTNLDFCSQDFYHDSWQAYGQKTMPVIKCEQIIKNTFQLMQKHRQNIKDIQKIFFIKIVRCYITQAVQEKQNYKLPIDQWESDYLGDYADAFIERQHIIQKCGGSDFIISVFSQNLTTRIELLNQALLLGIAYLFGGNTVCQNSILRSLIKDPQNLMLVSFKAMIKKTSQFLREVRKIQQIEGNRTFAINIVDTHDYYNPKQNALLKFFNQKKYDKFEEHIQVLNEYALCRMFRLLQLFGENNNIQMKKFLTYQVNEDENRKINFVNFIDEGCLVLRNLYKIMNNRVVNIPKYILGFIGQISQVPCIDNQVSFIKSTYFQDLSYMAAFLNDQSNRNIRKICAQSQLDELYGIYEDSIKIALSNFEGRDQIIISEFLNKCHPRFLWMCIKKNLDDLIGQKEYQNIFQIGDKQTNQKVLRQIIKSQRKDSQIYQGKMQSILNVLTIIKHINDWIAIKTNIAAGDPQNPLNQDKKQAEKGQQFINQFQIVACEQYQFAKQFLNQFNNQLIQIQVSCYNGKSIDFQFIYFPFHPIFHYLAAQTKDSIMMEVDRGTQRDKLITLLDFREDVYTQIKWNYQLNYFNTQIFGYKIDYPITSQLCQNIRNMARKCSYIICLLLACFIFVDHDVEQRSSIFVFDSILTFIPIRILCLIQLGLTLLYCALWGKMRATLAIVKYNNLKSDQEQGAKQKGQDEQLEDQKVPKEGWVSVSKKLSAYYSGFYNKYSQFKGLITQTNFYCGYILPVVAIAKTQSGFLSLAMFVVASFLGNFYGVEWYTIHLFDFFVNIPMLSNVFKAIIINIKQLTILSLLATAFILVFNVLSFSTYTVVIYEDEVPEQACTDILNCILELYTSGVINGDMEQFDLPRFVFDISYVVFMELLFQNLVGGIMIDGFASLRQADSARDQDKSGQCYICSKTKANMQKDGQTFAKHINGHFLWYYLYYIYLIQNKDQTDLTGIQYDIRMQISSQQVNWFPSKGQNDGGNQIQEKLKQLSQKVTELCSKNKDFVDLGVNVLENGKKSVRKKLQSIKQMPEMPIEQ